MGTTFLNKTSINYIEIFVLFEVTLLDETSVLNKVNFLLLTLLVEMFLSYWCEKLITMVSVIKLT